MPATLHLVKLSVGTENLADLAAWQSSARAQGADGLPRHVTRMWPRRADLLLDGGSIYWVIGGMVQVRQRILRLDPVTGTDGIARCAIILDPDLRRTRPLPRRPFQGWRYLPAGEAPDDLRAEELDQPDLPGDLARALEEIGVR